MCYGFEDSMMYIRVYIEVRVSRGLCSIVV